jgi:alkanesulfonate monooxygenase SsuD/methylene tetrahydromethanopterin reductase-like flavin-dependent oxidoreductase (luciferase family)
MELHWMSVRDDSDLISLKRLSHTVNEAGYKSILLVYHSLLPDYMIKVARIMDPKHSFKYMFAIRTYAVSPELCAMMMHSFHEIDKDRVMLNVAAGDMKDDEDSVNNMVFISDQMETKDQRVLYTAEWIEKFLKHPMLIKKPDIVISGTSDKTIESSEKYADIHLAMLSTYKEGFKVNTKRKMASTIVIIRDTNEEAKAVANQEKNYMMRNSMVYGTEEVVIEKLKKLSLLGITDILVSDSMWDDQLYRLHKMTKSVQGVL